MDNPTVSPNIFINEEHINTLRNKKWNFKLLLIIGSVAIAVIVLFFVIRILLPGNILQGDFQTAVPAVPRLEDGQEILTPAKISLKAPKNDFKVGEDIEVTIYVNTGGRVTDGTDAVLKFEPKILEASSSSISIGTIYPDYPIAKVKDDTIRISGISSLSGGTFKGEGVLATVSFKAKGAGKTQVMLDFTPGGTADANIVESSSGDDLLQAVENLEVKIR